VRIVKPAEGADVPKFNGEFSLGNALSMLTTLFACGALVYHLSAALADLRGNDRVLEQRIARTETLVTAWDRDARDFAQKVARIEANSEMQLRILQRLESLVYRRADAPAPSPP
jgi:hypothetical protein